MLQILALIDALGLHLALVPTERCLPVSASWRKVTADPRPDAQHRGQFAVEDLLAVGAQVVEIIEYLFDPATSSGEPSICTALGLSSTATLSSVFKQVKVFVAGSEQSFEIGRSSTFFFIENLDSPLARRCADGHAGIKGKFEPGGQRHESAKTAGPASRRRRRDGWRS